MSDLRNYVGQLAVHFQKAQLEIANLKTDVAMLKESHKTEIASLKAEIAELKEEVGRNAVDAPLPMLDDGISNSCTTLLPPFEEFPSYSASLPSYSGSTPHQFSTPLLSANGRSALFPLHYFLQMEKGMLTVQESGLHRLHKSPEMK